MRFLKGLAVGVLGALVTLLVGALVATGLALQGAPSVTRGDDVSPADVDRAVTMLRQHDPRLAADGRVRSMPLAERDIDLLLDHAAQRWLAGRARVQLVAGRAQLYASVPGPGGRWWNIELGLRQAERGLPQIDRVRVGRLPVPAAFALPVLRAVAAHRGVQVDALDIARSSAGWIDSVAFGPGTMQVAYRLGPDAANRVRAALVTPADAQRLHAYAERLAAVSHGLPGEAVSLTRLLVPMFNLAAQRSSAGADAVDENRAALMTLALYANRRPLGTVLPAAHAWPAPRWVTTTLQQRPDFALHFIVSAALAAQARAPLADAVGLWKELADARPGGSGFSFNDLAADRAGTRLGEQAVGPDARRVQQRLAAGATEADVMPAASDLPESLSEAELIARYGGVGAAPYNRMLAEIEARVAALPLYR